MRKNAKLVRVSAASLAKIEETSKLSKVPIEQVTDDAIECGLLSDQFEAIYGPMIEFRKIRHENGKDPDGSIDRGEASQTLQDAQLPEVHGSEGSVHEALHGEEVAGEEEC